MASIYYAKKNTAWSLPIVLFPPDSTEWIASPTIAAGDFKVSTYDGAGTNETGASNLTNIPATSPASSGLVVLKLTASEMNHDIVSVTWKDPDGTWQSGALTVYTTPHTLGEAALEASVTTVDTVVDGIKAVTDNLPDSGALTTIDANVDAILADTGTDGVVVASGSKTGYSLSADQSGVTVGTVNALGTQAKADVNAEMVDVLTTDTYAEPGSVPAATSSLKDKINWLFALARNKMTQTADTQTLRNDADDGSIATSSTSDNGTTFTRGEWS